MLSFVITFEMWLEKLSFTKRLMKEYFDQKNLNP